jgi:hypothetical protein
MELALAAPIESRTTLWRTRGLVASSANPLRLGTQKRTEGSSVESGPEREDAPRATELGAVGTRSA